MYIINMSDKSTDLIVFSDTNKVDKNKVGNKEFNGT